MAAIAAKRLVEHLDRCGFILVLKPPELGGAQIGAVTRGARTEAGGTPMAATEPDVAHVRNIAGRLDAAACAVQRVATLAPTNDVASTTGVVAGHFLAYGTGEGEASLALPTGEVLIGEYHIDRSPVFGFGDVIVAALTKQGAAALAAAVGDYQQVSPGEAIVANANGKSAQCEFYNNNITGHGGGACRLWNGAAYQLSY